MKKLKVAFVTTTQTDALPLISAINKVNKERTIPVTVRVFANRSLGDETSQTSSNIDEFIEFAPKSNIVILHLMSEPPEFNKLITCVKDAGVPVAVVASSFRQNKDYLKLSTVNTEDYHNILFYINYGGQTNFENLLFYLANRFVGTSCNVDVPVPSKWQGIYHPDFGYVPDLDEYLEKKVHPNRLTVGVWFHQSYWQGGNTLFVDSLVTEIENQGANVIPVFFSGRKNESLGVKGFDWILENYFMKDGKPLVDVIISTLSYSWSTSSSGGSENLVALEKLGVPVIKALLTFNTFEGWHDTPLGLRVVDLPLQVALPEFDGFIITVPLATTDMSTINPETGAKITKHVPIPERVAKVVRLSLNWAKLRHISNSEKKVAIIFHNYPPRNDNIGKAFGLDSSVSVLNILKGLKEQGYSLDYLPENGQELMDTVLTGLTNDRKWLSSEELAQRALAKVSTEHYTEWFDELSQDAKEKLMHDWGAPPGKLFNYNNKLLVPGILNGNVFIGLQPPRGFLENPAAVYHSPDLSMPHHYYAYYRWIRDVFKANVVMHIGKHGTLEWLPGKSVALSNSCFPDALISDLPNIYPYIINNPSEGTQAKRRSYCCLIDHLIPVMHNADTYEELAQLEVQLKEYYDTKIADSEKLPVLQKLIWETVVSAKLNIDLNVTEADAFADFDDFLELLHGYLNELLDTQISDGLHILGEPPAGERLEEFLVTLTRLRNGAVPSLRQAVAELKGYDYDELLQNRGKLRLDGRTNSDVIKELSELCLELMKRFNDSNFSAKSIDDIVEEVLGKKSTSVRECLLYVERFLVPNLNKTTDELTNILSACEGNYVPAGPSGAITRGMADILPTGRNFYSVDPLAIPARASWQVGIKMADALLERYIKDEGKYPESVGMIIWGMVTMTTKGDDIAEILYLLGVKPVWEEGSGRVVGIEPIPLEKLKRPRIDVTVRISGVFRDTFPNIVHLIDDAVNLVADLEESEENNYVAKHVKNEVKERTTQGEDEKKAKEEASYRIFSARPGAYGCGLTRAIDSKNWKDQKDLTEIYLNWGSFAYSRKTYGVSVPEQFKLRLSKINLTVKNEASREYDILSCDDWYDFHGGMITSIKTLTGKKPSSYCSDGADPDRIKVRNTAEETCHVLRSRLLNPKYIEGLMKQGYQGAAELSRAVDFVFGWDATTETVEDWMYEKLAEKYTLNKEMQEWLKDVNPYALQNMTERLLEAIQRNLWDATDEMKKELQRLYLDIEGILESTNE
ncbi:MAG: cobaltochelatase subunit CobN [archaeon]